MLSGSNLCFREAVDWYCGPTAGAGVEVEGFVWVVIQLVSVISPDNPNLIQMVRVHKSIYMQEKKKWFEEGFLRTSSIGSAP